METKDHHGWKSSPPPKRPPYFEAEGPGASPCSAVSIPRLEAIIEKDIRALCCIYPTLGTAFYDECRARLIKRVAQSIFDEQNR